jgi:hypothetical protein
MLTMIWFGKLTGRYCLQDRVVRERIIQKCMVGKQMGRVDSAKLTVTDFCHKGDESLGSTTPKSLTNEGTGEDIFS